VARRSASSIHPDTEARSGPSTADYRPELRGTREARDAARYLLLQPPLPLAARAPYGVIAGAAVALMPAWTRLPLRLPWLPVSEAVAAAPAGEIVTRTLRWATTPPPPDHPAASHLCVTPGAYGDPFRRQHANVTFDPAQMRRGRGDDVP
jgi:hypothetical protein